jgi:signal transduction histidine kinase
MGIRAKIALGFVLLTVVIVSSVSFWAAQSLGFSIEASDYKKLEALKNEIAASLRRQYEELVSKAVSSAKSFKDLNMLNRNANELQKFSENLKTNLNLDWLEIYADNQPVLNGKSRIDPPPSTDAAPVRISSSGPYSYFAYLTAQHKISHNTRLYLAQRPDFSNVSAPMFSLFDNQGIFDSANFPGSHDLLKKLYQTKVTGEIKVEDEIYRARVFKLSHNCFVLVGYPAQRTMISQLDVDHLMIRLAVLQVLGLLVLGYFLGRRLLAPLKALGTGIEKVAEGDWKEIPLDKPPMQNSGDEIESVARSFNKMVRELSAAQQRLIEVQKELAKKEKLAALGRFSAGIAHEINNPLGTILANAGLLKDSIENKAEISAEEIEEIISEVKRCKNIISTLRTYTSQTRPVLSCCDLEKAFAQLVGKIINDPNFSDITVKLVHQAYGKAKLDMAAMQQVFVNLANNAAEALENNDYKELIISLTEQENHFIISFKDNGPGFDCEPELIFEPLFTTKARGTGLGLIICQAIVEGHNGKIVARREDPYTEFQIMLPFSNKD